LLTNLPPGMDRAVAEIIAASLLSFGQPTRRIS